MGMSSNKKMIPELTRGGAELSVEPNSERETGGGFWGAEQKMKTVEVKKAQLKRRGEKTRLS